MTRDADRIHNYRCSECGRRGHNARTCDEHLETTMKPRSDAVTFDVRGGCWGNSIEWFSRASPIDDQLRVVGWKDPKPRVGDILKSPMKSGRVGIFVFIAVEHPGDPPDMFFGTVVQIGYEGAS